MVKMAANKNIFVDTNVLAYSNIPLSPFYRQANKRLKKLRDQGIEIWISRQVLREYIVSMTGSNHLTKNTPLIQTVSDVRYFANNFIVAEDNVQITDILLSLIEQIPMGGKQIHDANIAATM